MPADPESGELLRIARFGEDVGDFVDAQAALVGCGNIRAVLAFAIQAGELSGKLRLLGQQPGISGRGGRIDLQEQNLAAEVGRKRDVIEAMALSDKRE